MSEDLEPVAASALPELGAVDLLEVPPGRVLADLLEAVDPSVLHGLQLVDVVAAHQKQVCYAQAGLLRAVHELVRAVPDVFTGPPRRLVERHEGSGAEVAFALTISDYAAEHLLAAADVAIRVAPELIAALEAGELDLAKLDMLSREVAEVDEDEQVRTVVAVLRPEFPRCTVAQLRAKVRALLLSLDPDGARERHAKTVEKRWVEHYEYANGTSALTGYYLNKDKAAAAWSHIDAIAHATKSAGDPLQRSLDQIRADVFADLLAGVDPTAAGAAEPAPRKGVINLHIGLSTLALLDNHPGEIPGFGPVLADIARQAAAQIADTARWRFTLETDDGEAVAEGRLRYRPTLSQRAFISVRDRTCVAPGCQRPASACDIDHIRAWADGGPTTVDNLTLLCRLCRRRHNRHYAEHRIMPRSVLKALRCNASVAGGAA